MSLDFEMRPEWEELRDRARKVAAEGVAAYGKWHDSWVNGYSKEFSQVLAAEGWIGMTWPTEVGGGGRPGIERIIMAEEMISAGAPIAASWVADRQMGPAIFTYGTPDQQAEFLPGILSGEATWCIGMSEPDAGSDLAALKTSAVRDGHDFILNGQKIWTSLAAIAEYCYLICRTDSSGPPHKGVSELIVPMDLPGIEVRTVADMIGNDHFCEVFFTDVRVPAENLVGVEGDAFRQTMAQLAHERGGIDRLVSNRPLYDLALEQADRSDPLIRQEIVAIETGYRIGRMMVYQGALGQARADFSAGTKAYCTEHEQRVAQFAARVLGPAGIVGDEFPHAIAYAPAYTIQGGTSPIMRNILGERVLKLPPRAQVAVVDLGLEGKTALITGSYRGTGAGIARVLAAEGVHVIVHGFEAGQPDAVVADIAAAGGSATPVVADIATDAGAGALAEHAASVDVLVNNYGAPVGSSWTSMEDWADEWNRNVLTSVRVTQLCLPGMRERGWGRIIFVGTIGTRRPGTHNPGYYGAKAGLPALVRTLAMEVRATGITANLVSPGMIATAEVREMLTRRAAKRDVGPDWGDVERWGLDHAMANLTDRIPDPEDIGRVVAMVASDAAWHINGADLAVDGGAIDA